MNEVQLLDLLKRLLPSEFEEVILRAGVPREHLLSHAAPQAERAIQLIQWAKQSDEHLSVLIDATGPRREPRPAAKAAPATAGAEPILTSAPSLPIVGRGADLPSRSPIVIAVEEQNAPLDEEEFLKTERHVTVALSGGQIEALEQIGACLLAAQSLEDLARHGRRA